MTRVKSSPLLVFMLGSLTAFAPMSIDMYLPALPTLQRILHTDASRLQLTLASFFLAFAIGQLFYGPLADRFGRKPPLYASLSLFIVASIGCALASSVDALIVLRFFQAFGACAGVVIARAIVRDSFVTADAAKMYAAMMLVMGVAPMLAPILGGQLLKTFGWHAIFIALAVYGSVIALIMHRHLPETLAMPLRQPLVLTRIIKTYGLLLAEHRYRGFAFASGLSMAGLYSFIAASPFVFIDYFKLTTAEFGWVFAANAFWLIMSSQINGRLVQYYKPLFILKRSLVVQLFAGIALATMAWGESLGWWTGVWHVLPPLFLYTACLGFILPNATIMAMEPHSAHAGTASALYGTISSLFGAIAATIASALHANDARTLCTIMAVCGATACLRSRFLKAT